jgi:hypothetical protein
MSTLFLNFPSVQATCKELPLHLHTPHITISELPYCAACSSGSELSPFSDPWEYDSCSFHENQFLDFEEEPVLFEASSPVGGWS